MGKRYDWALRFLVTILSVVALSGCQSAPKEERSVHFTAAGDMGMGKGANAVLDVVAQLKPDFNVALGDLSYQRGAERDFCSMVTRKLGAEFPYQLVAGNHESDGSDGDINKFMACLPNRMPNLQGEYGKQWYVDVPREQPLVRVILISPGLKFDGGELDYSRDSKRWQWTESAIDEGRAANIPWIVVGMHTPCFTLGRYECEAGESLTNLLIDKKVDLVLNGHEHVYQRTHQLSLGSECSYMYVREVSKDCVVDTDNSMRRGEGTVFTTVGVGGRQPREINREDKEAPYFATWSGGNDNPTLGTLSVKATSDRMDVKLVPAAGYNYSDAFSIEK